MALRTAQGLAALLGLASPALAEDCRLALVLALDVSTSVDAAEERLQREGLAQALLAPEVVQAFLAGGPVALYVFEWSHAASQKAILPGWQMVRSEEDLAAIATSILLRRRSRVEESHAKTALGAALAHAAIALHDAPPAKHRRSTSPATAGTTTGSGRRWLMRSTPSTG